MKQFMASWARLARRFGRDDRANVAMMFGIALIPMVGATGIAFDYTRASAARDKLDNALDMAVLASLSKNAGPFATPPTRASVQQYFTVAASNAAGVTVTSFDATTSESITTMSVTASYSAEVPATFSSILGFKTIAVGGTSTATVNAPPYINFYLLLDNSPSMGLGATATDISHLQSLTPDSCAFACHQHTFNSKKQITGDLTSDYYHIARNNGVTLRIDVLRTATQQLTQTAAGAETQSNQFSMGVYTFSDTFQTISDLSASMPTVASNASAIDLAYAYNDQRDAQTSFDTAMRSINSVMPNPGNGSSQASPTEFLFLVTDGIADEPSKSNSGSGDPADAWANGSSASNSKPNLSNQLAGNVSTGRLISTLTPSALGSPSFPASLKSDMCQSIKARGIKIAVLYTPYLPVTNNSFYNSWVGPLNNSPINPNDTTDPAGNLIGQALKTCASPGFYFQVTPTQGITQAMQAMFQAAVNSVLLTR